MKTLDEIVASGKMTLGSTDVAPILGVDSYTVVLLFRQKILPVTHYFSGNRLHIITNSFLDYMGYKREA